MTEPVAHLLERIAQQHLSGLLAVLFGQGSDLRVAEAHATHERTPRLRGVSGAHEHTHACDARVTGEPVAAAIARALGARVSAQRRTSSAMPCAVQNATTSVRVMNGCKSICEACPVCQSPASFIVGVDGDVPRAPPADIAGPRRTDGRTDGPGSPPGALRRRRPTPAGGGRRSCSLRRCARVPRASRRARWPSSPRAAGARRWASAGGKGRCSRDRTRRENGAGRPMPLRSHGCPSTW